MWIVNNHKTQLALSEVVSPANQGTAVAVSAAAAAAQQADCTHTTLQPDPNLVPVSASLFHLDLRINVMPCLSSLSVVLSVSTALVVANAECWWVWLQRWLHRVCRGLLPQSYACSHLNEMCPAAAIYISRDEEIFLPSILLKILPCVLTLHFFRSLSLSPAERELLLTATEAINLTWTKRTLVFNLCTNYSFDFDFSLFS